MTAPTPSPAPRPERSFPVRCPDCQQLLADTAKPHCDWTTNQVCDWMRCKCGTHINPAGTWTNGFRRGVA